MNRRRLTILVMCATLAANPAGATSERKAAKKACIEVKQKIRKLESRMRAGYTASQGIRLDEKMRQLKKKRYRVCR